MNKDRYINNYGSKKQLHKYVYIYADTRTRIMRAHAPVRNSSRGSSSRH